ncbi:uncharacterized protein C8Q71DRAFT_447812 [Rhodofomes roseus]|uniref:ABM domain-containing protein n=1 Tax=Rhodofomes roseus TaxID=34475 RepID=A0ABQ8JXY1_9APHY|nr:uncharacterized protein C8Q71DRAFT_447812 [Rhodofomes roseus]KAH9829083.1 hypothetical protein C8Q71DRAFT_447812 [Rhodofomes roseus]
MVTVELLIVDLRDGVDLQSPAYNRLREAAAKAGLTRQYYGSPIEDTKKLYWVLPFDQGFEPKDLVWPEQEYGNFFKEVQNIATAEPISYFVPFDGFPEELAAAPVTEFAVCTLKGDVEAYKKAQEAAIEELHKAPAVHEARYSVIEVGGKHVSVIFVGWDSMEAHQVWGTDNSGKLQAIAPFLESATLVHVPLKMQV